MNETAKEIIVKE